jgi:hypothetical protein
LIEVPIGEDDEEYAQNASDDEDSKGKGGDKPKTKDAVRDLKKFEQITN